MSIIHWDPFASFDDTFSRLVPGAFGRIPRVALQNDAKFEWRPSADIVENDKEFLIRAELPAVRKEDVNVTVDADIITIQGERKREKETGDEKTHRIESFYGSFMRRFALPDNVETDAIRCESRDGVLTVHIPKAKIEKQKAKQIKVE